MIGEPGNLFFRSPDRSSMLAARSCRLRGVSFKQRSTGLFSLKCLPVKYGIVREFRTRRSVTGGGKEMSIKYLRYWRSNRMACRKRASVNSVRVSITKRGDGGGHWISPKKGQLLRSVAMKGGLRRSGEEGQLYDREGKLLESTAAIVSHRRCCRRGMAGSDRFWMRNKGNFSRTETTS